MPGKQARALCPVCQEPMPPDKTECENCGAFVIDEAVVRLSRAFGIDREKALALFEKGFRHPKQLADRDVDDVLRTGGSGLLFLCTNCGGFVATADTRCSRCGAEFEPAEAPPPAAERDILDMVLCPVCGADNDPAWDDCEICGQALRGGLEVPETAAACPVCGAAKRGILAPCPVCNAPQEEPALEKVDAILEDLDHAETPVPAAPRIGPHPAAEIPRTATATRGLEVAIKPRSAPESAALPSRSARVQAAVETGRPPKASPRPAPPKAPTRRARTLAGRPSTPRTLRMHRRALPPEMAGALVAASALGLYLSQALQVPAVAWGLDPLLAVVCTYGAAMSAPRRPRDLGRTDAFLLTAGLALGVMALPAPSGWNSVLAVVGALPLALATRRLLRGDARMVLVVTAALGLLAYGMALVLGLSVVSTSAWTLGLLALAPWPAALAAEELRRRHFAGVFRTHLVRAEHDVGREEYAESVKDYDRAIALGRHGTPGEEVPWYGKGAALIVLGRYDEALRAIDRALDINPRNEVAWLNKGNALMKLGRLVDALRSFNASLKVNPRYEVAWNNKGNCLARMGHYEEALGCYEKALSIDPDYRGSWVNKGYVLTKLGRYTEAASCADRALKLAHARAGPA